MLDLVCVLIIADEYRAVWHKHIIITNAMQVFILTIHKTDETIRLPLILYNYE